MKEDNDALNNLIIGVEEALEKHKDKEDVKEAYERIKALKEKRGIE